MTISFNLRGLHAQPKRVRLTWWSNPSTTMAIGWALKGPDIPSELCYAPRALWLKNKHFTHCISAQVPIDKDRPVYWVQLNGLSPKTAYQFMIKSENGDSRALWFETAPDKPSDLLFIAGGDSRNHRNIRRAANRMVAMIAPTAVLFGGDFTARDSKKQWKTWFKDWRLSISEDGRMTPLIPARGNHDSELKLSLAWGNAFPQFYYALSFGGDLLRIYTLNSERPAGGEQRAWLERDLEHHRNIRIKFAQYHKPMRPHVQRKSEGDDEYTSWAPLFSKFGLDVAIECDSHVMKVTWPLLYDPQEEAGFKQSAKVGTTFIGEGGWGAPLRTPNDLKSWTRFSGRLNHFFFIHVYADGAYTLKPIEIQLKDLSLLKSALNDSSQVRRMPNNIGGLPQNKTIKTPPLSP